MLGVSPVPGVASAPGSVSALRVWGLVVSVPSAGVVGVPIASFGNNENAPATTSAAPAARPNQPAILLPLTVPVACPAFADDCTWVVANAAVASPPAKAAVPASPLPTIIGPA